MFLPVSIWLLQQINTHLKAIHLILRRDDRQQPF